jgi:hypothetical protein
MSKELKNVSAWAKFGMDIAFLLNKKILGIF